MSGKNLVPFFLSFESDKYFKNCMTLNPKDRESLKESMKDPWLNIRQEEILRPYSEPPCDDLDSWVTERGWTRVGV